MDVTKVANAAFGGESRYRIMGSMLDKPSYAFPFIRQIKAPPKPFVEESRSNGVGRAIHYR